MTPGDRVKVRGREGPWVVRSTLRLGGLVVAPEGDDKIRQHVARGDCEPWTEAGPEAVPDGMSLGQTPPPWLGEVVPELLGAWDQLWQKMPPQVRALEVAANLAATVVSDWVLNRATAEQLLDLAPESGLDPRPQAIGALVGVVFPVAWQVRGQG